tara:strand:- start:427 stop:621 length:195 start_codon:yes stop_codon:yes gene_type:complete
MKKMSRYRTRLNKTRLEILLSCYKELEVAKHFTPLTPQQRRSKMEIIIAIRNYLNLLILSQESK